MTLPGLLTKVAMENSTANRMYLHSKLLPGHVRQSAVGGQICAPQQLKDVIRDLQLRRQRRQAKNAQEKRGLFRLLGFRCGGWRHLAHEVCHVTLDFALHTSRVITLECCS